VSSTAPGDGGVFDAHHHLWDTRVLEYRLFRRLPDLDRPFLLGDYEQEARNVGVTGSLWVEAASAGADGTRELEW
jgi:predicted TIM-barrel fold metal-dependent hydrolase